MAYSMPLLTLARHEVKQRGEEGCDVTGFEERVEAAAADERELLRIYEELQKLPVREDYPFSEPSELEAIRSDRPEGPRILPDRLTDDQWKDKFYGAWLGRCIGCALGKPLEHTPFMAGDKETGRQGWENIYLWYQGAGAWPIQEYVPLNSTAAQEYGLQLNPHGLRSTRENIRFMETDDDIRYTVLALTLLEEKGLDWNSWDIGHMWLLRLPYFQVYTAERAAYQNFTDCISRLEYDRSRWNLSHQEWVRTYMNPYREWIGAQIRVDGLAYGAAGRPELAAELAWRDASFSHVKNGIYGAMFVAAMIAAAFVTDDPEKIVAIGLSEIPAKSRLAQDIHTAVKLARSAADSLELVKSLWEAFGHYHPVHTINNAALVAASLVFAKGDFEKAITTSVLGGWDTDCNGATVGSIMGAIYGAERLPESWKSPLNDTLYAEISGFDPIAISECARRSYEVFRKLRNE